MRGIVLFAHGARDPEWSRPFEAIRDRLRAQRPEYPVELAYLEMMSPRLDEAIDALVAEGATIVMVTHDPRYLSRAGRNVYLFDGRIVPGAPRDREVA